MDLKEQEYKELFLAEALENHEELNRLMTELEKNTSNKNAINAIFRITHTLKGNAAGMGFDDIGKLAHTLEDLFNEIREGKLQVDTHIFNDIFKAIDVLGALINALKTGKTVRYQGIKAKLEVILKKASENALPAASGQNALTPEDTSSLTNEKANQPPFDIQGVQPSETDKEVLEQTQQLLNQIIVSQEVVASQPEQADAVSDQVEADTASVDTQITFSDLVQVPVKKLDNLLNLVSELTIERDRLIAVHAGKLSKNEYSRLQRISSDLQYSVMDVRLVQVGFLFNKFHRVVRDAAAIENKKVALKPGSNMNKIQSISDN